MARTVQPFEIRNSKFEILVFLLASERNQLRSVYFDPLLLQPRGVFFLESISWKFKLFLLLKNSKTLVNNCAQSFRTLPLKTGVDTFLVRCATLNFLLCAWFLLVPYSAVLKKLYASKEVKENALASEGKSCRPENNNYSQSICMSWPLSVKHAAKITFAQYKSRTFRSIIYPADKNNFFGISSILAWGKGRVGQPPPFYCYVISASDNWTSLNTFPVALAAILDKWRATCCNRYNT